MKITVIGCGETGGTICSLLLSRYKKIELNILDPDENISGRILDLKHAAAIQNSEISHNDFEIASVSDYIFFTAGIRGEPGEDRSKKAEENRALIAEIFEDFTPKKESLIITISNPVESMAYWIDQHLKHKNTVIGTGTALDTSRLQWIIANYRNLPIEQVKTLVIGEHGSTMTPIWSSTFLGKKPITDVLSSEILEKLHQELLNSAKSIRETETATRFGVGQCAVDLMERYISGEITTLAFSYSTENIDSFEGSHFYLSWPCKIGKKTISPLRSVEMSHSEKENFDRSVQVLKSNVSEV